MPSLLDLSAELQVAIIDYLDTPATRCDPPAAYWASRTSPDLASLSACCQTLHRLAAPALYRNIRLIRDDKIAKSLQAVGNSLATARLVRELNFETMISCTVEEDYDELMPLSEEDFPSSVEEVLSHPDRFPNLEFLSVQFKLGHSVGGDEFEAVAGDTWQDLDDPYRDFDQLKWKEESAGFRATMAKTYDAIARSERPSTLAALELRNLLPNGVSSFNTAPW